MNRLYLLAISLSLFSSVCCTKYDENHDKNDDSNLEYVNFSVDIKSRATAENFEVADNIGIYAIECKEDGSNTLSASGNLADNRKYTYGNNGSFTSEQPIRANPENKYNYYAYYPYSDAITSAIGLDFSVSLDQSTHKEFTKSDFLYSKLSENVGSTANLQFKHKMSLLKFNLTLPSDVNSADEIQMTLLNLCRSAKIDLNNCSITIDESDKQPILPKISGDFPTTTIVAQAIVVPQTIKANTTLFSIKVGQTTFVYKPTDDIICSSGFTREFNVNVSGNSQLEGVIVLPEMETYLTEGVATLMLTNTSTNVKTSVNAFVDIQNGTTKINILDALASATYSVDAVSYSVEDIRPIGAIIDFVAKNEVTTDKWYEPLACFGEGSQTKPYKITHRLQLDNLATLVNGSQSFAGKIFKQACDIDLGGTQWLPIGTQTNPFSGNFDGAGFKISGLKMSFAVKSLYLGLFGYVNGTSNVNLASIKSVNLISSVTTGQYDIHLTAGRSSFYAGSVAGCVKDNAIIENCTSTLKISGNSAVGGIVGGTGYDLPQVVGTFGDGTSYANVTVRNCHFSGEILAQGEWVSNPGQGAAGMTGGIVGRNHGLVERCSNSGSLTALSTYEWGYEMVGGVVGGNGGTVKECFNTGSFTARPNGTAKDSGISCGGIVGQALLSAVTNVMLKSFIQDCYNMGDITYNGASCGGILGKTGAVNQVGSQIDRCYNIGRVEAKNGGILGNYNVKAGLFDIEFCITSPTRSSLTTGTTITDWTLFNKGTRRNVAVGTGRIKKAASDESMMQKATYNATQVGTTGVYWDWDFDTVWQIDEGTSCPYLRNNAPQTIPTL